MVTRSNHRGRIPGTGLTTATLGTSSMIKVVLGRISGCLRPDFERVIHEGSPSLENLEIGVARPLRCTAPED